MTGSGLQCRGIVPGLAAAAWAVPALAQTSTGDVETGGDCSPVVVETGGNVTINVECATGLSPLQLFEYVGFIGLLIIFFFIQRGRAKEAIIRAGADAGPSPAYDRRIEWLRSDDFVQAYRRVLQSALNVIARVIGDDRREEAERRPGEGWVAPPAWSFKSYLIVLGLAVFYPILFVAAGWVASGDGYSPGWQRALIPAGLVVAMSLAAWAGVRLRRRRWLSGFLLLIAACAVAAASAEGAGGFGVFATAGAFAGIFAAGAVAAAAAAGTGAFAVTAAFVFAFAVACAVAGPVGGAVAFAVFQFSVYADALVFAFALAPALAVTGAVVFAGAALRQRKIPVWLELFLAGVLALALTAGLLFLFAVDGSSPLVDIGGRITPGEPRPDWWPGWLPWAETPTLEARGFTLTALILFLSLLPAANALMDWPSLGVSRMLLNRIADGRHDALSSIIFAVLDLLVALIFFVLMAMTAAGVLALAEHLQRLGGAEPLVDISAILDRIRANPLSGNYGWIYLMLLTTLIPTAIHFLAALGSAATFVFATPLGLRRPLIRLLEKARADTDKAWSAAGFYSLMQTAGLGIAVLGLYGVWRLVSDYAFTVGLWVLGICGGLVAAIEAWDGWPFF